MQLYYTPSSPYARKVLMLVKLLGMRNIELIRVNPMKDHALREINPLGKVPALVDGEMSLFESRLICEYLDEKSGVYGSKTFFQRDSLNYYGIQKAHALADGILDAAFSTVMELRRKDSEHSGFWLERWHVSMIHALKNINVASLGTSDDVHIGTIATISALGYLDFRLPPLNWRECNRELRTWYDSICEEPWVKATAPEET
jgi:glutathione S-transferase